MAPLRIEDWFTTVAVPGGYNKFRCDRCQIEFSRSKSFDHIHIASVRGCSRPTGEHVHERRGYNLQFEYDRDGFADHTLWNSGELFLFHFHVGFMRRTDLIGLRVSAYEGALTIACVCLQMFLRGTMARLMSILLL